MNTTQENLWHYSDGASSYGPLTSSVVRQLDAASVIQSHFKFRREENDEWIPWSEVDLDAPLELKDSSPPAPENLEPTSYHLTVAGTRSGPFLASEIRDMIMRREVTENDHVWTEGMNDWVTVAHVPSLRPNGSTPPPPPPSSVPTQSNRNVFQIYFFDVLLNQYADFKGRASRKQYWMFILFYCLVSFCIGFMEGLLGLDGTMTTIYGLAILVPLVAIGVRRMQDTNHNGWWLFCPVVNLVFALTEGTNSPNRYGHPPIL